MDTYWFDTSGQYQHKKKPGFREAGKDTEKQNLCCAVCRNMITSRDDAIQIEGAHQHTKLNPEGHKFLIRCFSLGASCRYKGDASTFNTWFGGYSWRFAHCSKCDVQLGWFFQGKEQFLGLIQEQLISCDS